GTEAPHDAGLLTDHDHALAAGQRAQHRRVAEVEVGTEILRAVLDARAAADEERVGARRLVPPQNLAGLDVHRDDRIARLRRRLGVRVAPADVDGAALLVDRRAAPDGRARGRPLRRALRVLPRLHRRLGDRVALPDLIAGRRVERHDAAAEGAAFVGELRGRHFFDRRDRHVQAAVVERRRAGDARERVRVDLLFPDHFTGERVERVDVRFQVADIDRVLVARAADARRRAYAGGRLERPVDAARAGVERIQRAV